MALGKLLNERTFIRSGGGCMPRSFCLSWEYGSGVNADMLNLFHAKALKDHYGYFLLAFREVCWSLTVIISYTVSCSLQ